MMRKLNPIADQAAVDHGAIGQAAIDAALTKEEELIPTSGFLAATMERVREEAAMPKPISFPWLRALPGIVLVAAVFCWCGYEVVRAGFSGAGEASLAQVHIAIAGANEVGPVVWVAAALGFSLLSWLFARKLAGGAGLL
jgi:hypothetical protein